MAEFTCPMHPQIVRDAPGSCPICGMALERRMPSTDADEDHSELRDMTRRFWVATVFSIPLVILAMGDLLPGQPISAWLSMRTRTYWEFALATPVCVWSAWPFYVRAVQSVIHRSLNMFTLIGLGVSVAFGYSVVAAVAPGIFPVAFREAGEVAVYFEAAGVIVALGNRALLDSLGIDPGALADRAEALRAEAQTVMFVAVDGKAAGLLGVADPIKDSTPDAIAALHREGLRIVMLTGDSATTARTVAEKLGIDEVMAEVLPDQKAEKVKQLQAEGRVVAMAGDGTNDAPALAQAQVGIAMGTGTDVVTQMATPTWRNA